MAILVNIFCRACQQNKQVCCMANDYPSICNECEKQAKTDAKLAWMIERAKLPDQERLRKLESDIYDLLNKPERGYWDGCIG